MATAVAVVNIYLGLTLAPLEIEILLLQTAVLLVLSSLVGYLTEELDREEASAVEIDNALEISSLLAGALEEQIVYDRLTEVLARVFRAGRVAVILLSPESDVATVVSSVDQGEQLHDFQIELHRYPEITAAIERREPILIARAGSHPRLASVHGMLPRRARDAAILVTPIVEDEEPRGVVFIRIEDPGHEFTEREVRFSMLMAEVAARALGGAEHFARVAEAARRDSLTGLLNVRAFHERLGEEIERSERTGAQISLLMIDVDYLKHVNDSFGHMAGDAVLREMATVLEEQVRTIDTVARYGGEEFVVLLPETSAGRARVAAERLRKRLESTRHEGVPEPVTVSVPRTGGGTAQRRLKKPSRASRISEAWTRRRPLWILGTPP
jgi:diguanylate cyclase (GGDEF)-like protein